MNCSMSDYAGANRKVRIKEVRSVSETGYDKVKVERIKGKGNHARSL